MQYHKNETLTKSPSTVFINHMILYFSIDFDNKNLYRRKILYSGTNINKNVFMYS